MNFDRNTVIGFIVLALLFFGYFFYNNQQQVAYQKEKARQDSIARANQPKPPAANPAAPATPQQPAIQGDFSQYSTGTEQTIDVENAVMHVVFSSKGGQPKLVELKNYKAPDSSRVKLASTAFDKIDYPIIPGQGTANITNFYFTPGAVEKGADGSSIVSFSLNANGKSIVHRYTVKPNDYMIDFNLEINGAGQLLSNNTLLLTWQNQAMQLQKDLKYERQMSQVAYRVDGDYDYSSVGGNDKEDFKDAIDWISVKQQFFNTTLVSKQKGFTSGAVEWIAPGANDKKTIVQAIANVKVSVPTNNAVIPMGLYYGPTDYKVLNRYGNDMEDMVNLGSGMFAFVKYINRWIILPVFDFFTKLTTNYGIAILLLTLFIRLLTSPLMYPGYLTSAKMRVLRPELEELKKKYPDQQQYAMEQMKFTREAGVNQFAGCLPGLLQIPIFFALYSFFNSNVALRGQKFLWADDLSQYDTIVNFGFEIPLLGDHLSLFTITAVITSFLISLYSMNMTPDQGNPVLKYMPYFFPIILLFIFNGLPSGLTWYYTVSNLITLALQFVIQNYIINHDKILAQIEVNRKKPKKKSGWAEKLAELQEQQRKMQETQQQQRRNNKS